MGIREAIKEYFSAEKDIERVYLFGSRATGKNSGSSDVDIAVLLSSQIPLKQYTQYILATTDELSRRLNKEVDVVILNSANTFLKFQIIKNGSLVFERRDTPNHSFEAKSISEYFDFLPIRKRMEQALINRIKGA